MSISLKYYASFCRISAKSNQISISLFFLLFIIFVTWCSLAYVLHGSLLDVCITDTIQKYETVYQVLLTEKMR